MTWLTCAIMVRNSASRSGRPACMKIALALRTSSCCAALVGTCRTQPGGSTRRNGGTPNCISTPRSLISFTEGLLALVCSGRRSRRQGDAVDHAEDVLLHEGEGLEGRAHRLDHDDPF